MAVSCSSRRHTPGQRNQMAAIDQPKAGSLLGLSLATYRINISQNEAKKSQLCYGVRFISVLTQLHIQH